jgi:hypothetical protein
MVSRRAVLRVLAVAACGSFEAGCAPVTTRSAGGSKRVDVSVQAEPTPAPIEESPWEVLRAAGWTNTEIRAEGLFHRARMADPDYQAPPPDSQEGDLHRLLASIASELEGSEWIEVDLNSVIHRGTLMGRRGH